MYNKSYMRSLTKLSEWIKSQKQYAKNNWIAKAIKNNTI